MATMPNRRNFLAGLFCTTLGASARATEQTSVPAQSESDSHQLPGAGGESSPATGDVPSVPRPHYPRVMVNQVGFRPEAGKFVVVDGVKSADSFAIVKMHGKKGFDPSYTGRLDRTGTDLGQYVVGDFSDFHQPGIYRIRVRGNYPFAGESGTTDVWSHNFGIGADVWDGLMPKLVQYYRVQSCGPSKYGYHSPCHIGKIQRPDGGQAVPITGGWHAAHDHQRDVTETLPGAFGLTYLALARPDVDGDSSIFNEIRWGNDYFLAIQSRDGFLYEGVSASEYFKWNEKDWWDSDSYVLSTQPAQLYSQHNFITIQALIALHYRKRYPDYASRCLEAGQRCFGYVNKQWVNSSGSESVSYNLGTGVLAGVHMFRATGGDPYRTYAREMANRLAAVQAPDGYWSEKQASVSESILYSPFAAIGLSAAARWLAKDPDRARWIAALERFASNFVKYFSDANAFGILPCRIYPDRAPQKARLWKTQQYRYFIETNYSAEGPGYKFYWQTGNIATVSGYGVAMLYLSEILGQYWLRKLAQRQLDWALGVNPFDASMVLGVGRNQPPTYPSKEMVPGVPDIEGAVLQGPIGDEQDNPIILSGYYPTCEYWLPHHSWTLWLVAELSTDHPSGP